MSSNRGNAIDVLDILLEGEKTPLKAEKNARTLLDIAYNMSKTGHYRFMELKNTGFHFDNANSPAYTNYGSALVVFGNTKNDPVTGKKGVDTEQVAKLYINNAGLTDIQKENYDINKYKTPSGYVKVQFDLLGY